MGIKGIYKEIGPGKRIAVTKLAVDTLEQTGRPFRLAIDISIWQFQVQAAKGGSNPAIRTLFYRLLRLLGLYIQPIFVFDGPNKPAFKRNKRSGRGDGVATSMAKRMIRLFGFEAHDAPGEAEAECALLQQQGIVDAVLSEDVDTIMFGCKRTLRNWSAEGTRAKTPTHVSMHDVEELQQGGSGLDREGMVLVALMSGGDYLPEGIPGAGVKLACEAARAGFGKRLCQLKRADTSELNSWREWLTYELRNNESGFFRTRHKALHVPDDFPNLDVLRYYTHPVVSPASVLERLRNQTWGRPVDVQGLREFVRETFDWSYRIGAIKFIRVLAPCLLVRKLMDRSSRGGQESEDISSIREGELELVNSISSKRAHFSTDTTPELRVSFIPTNIVGYDFQEEPEEVISFGRDGLALNSDDEFGDEAEAVATKTAKKPFSPTEPDLFWLPETIAKFGIPLMVEDWEEAQRNKAKKQQKAKAPKQKAKVSSASAGALNKFAKVTKNIPKSTKSDESSVPPASQAELPPPATAPADIRTSLGAITGSSQETFPPVPCSQIPEKPRRSTTRSSKQTRSTSTTTKKSSRNAPAPATPNKVNPWTIASSQASSRRATTSTSTNANSKTNTTPTKSTPTGSFEAIVIPSSSPPTSPPACLQPAVRRPQRQQQKEASNNSPPSSHFPAAPSSPPLLISSSPPRPTNNKRRSTTPPPQPSPETVAPLHNSSARGASRRMRSPASPPPSLWLESPSPKPRRNKLARTESLPIEHSTTPRKHAAAGASKAPAQRGFARAQTIAVDTTLLSDSDLEAGGGEEEDDSDLDLPPLSSLANKLPAGAGTAKAKAVARSTRNAPLSSPFLLLSSPEPKPQDHHHHAADLSFVGARKGQEATTSTAAEAATAEATGRDDGSHQRLRMTKLYVPRKSIPGYFKEIDVSVDEAEVLKAHVAADGLGGGRRGRAWRRSDIECIDLTGYD
ncbi:hypothetical protein SLS62_004159 [Diatrype stigma]|uniref:Flap structure-specific endonuclease n=1 Tax=Diatrype stigma TaxID=117547 RepID=A0AAN9V3G7_9PEZI